MNLSEKDIPFRKIRMIRPRGLYCPGLGKGVWLMIPVGVRILPENLAMMMLEEGRAVEEFEPDEIYTSYHLFVRKALRAA